MKRHLMFTVQIVTIFIFAAVIATVCGFILSLILEGLFHLVNINSFINNVTLITLGTIFGYRLNDLMRDHKKKRDSISPELLLSK